MAAENAGRSIDPKKGARDVPALFAAHLAGVTMLTKPCSRSVAANAQTMINLRGAQHPSKITAWLGCAHLLTLRHKVGPAFLPSVLRRSVLWRSS
jgi:hypothetical protein